MTLDLAASAAKVARAFEHLAVLEREIPESVMDRGPYAIRFSAVDPGTGWCSMSLVPESAARPYLSVAFGDVVHNLRCALDYIVTALADASGVPITTQHQFPIYASRQQYSQKVGTVREARQRGPLGGLVHGLALMEQLQPYRLEPEPRTDPLWHVHRFSNADKHREVAGFLGIPAGSVQIAYEGIVAETEAGRDLQLVTRPRVRHLPYPLRSTSRP